MQELVSTGDSRWPGGRINGLGRAVSSPLSCIRRAKATTWWRRCQRPSKPPIVSSGLGYYGVLILCEQYAVCGSLGHPASLAKGIGRHASTSRGVWSTRAGSNVREEERVCLDRQKRLQPGSRSSRCVLGCQGDGRIVKTPNDGQCQAQATSAMRERARRIEEWEGEQERERGRSDGDGG